jgi:hypothetical protein
MKRPFKIVPVLGAAALIAVLVVLPASSAPASPGKSQAARAGRFYGIVPASRNGHRPSWAGLAGSSFTSTANLSYHNGPVMHTNKTYAIYWVPPGFTVSASYETLINKYFSDVAAASGASSNVYASDTQYYDNSNGSILYSKSTPDTFGGSFEDTSALPASGCSDAYTSACLTDSQLQTEIQNVAQKNGWTPSPTTMFFLFTANDIGSCTDSSSSVCAFSYYCAYHSNVGSGSNEVLYANMPYADAVLGLFCDAGPGPTGDDADATINVTSHEHNETITDPLGSAWYDSSGNENGDKCAWNFGTPLGTTQYGSYNQVINGHDYYLQQEWSNATSACVQTYTQASGTKQDQTITFGALSNQRFEQGPITVSATASSGLPVTFSSATTSACTTGGTNGATVTFLSGANATCTINANQPGDSNWNPAPQVQQSFTINKGNQTITFGAITTKTFDQSPLTVSATASSGLAVALTSATGPVCTVSGTAVTFVTTGTCTITANQSGNGNWNPAPQVQQNFTINQGNQTITFGALANRKLRQSPVTVKATASSGLPVSFSAAPSSVCTSSGTYGQIITLHARGTCTVTANQAGYPNYYPAPTVSRSFSVTT